MIEFIDTEVLGDILEGLYNRIECIGYRSDNDIVPVLLDTVGAEGHPL